MLYHSFSFQGFTTSFAAVKLVLNSPISEGQRFGRVSSNCLTDLSLCEALATDPYSGVKTRGGARRFSIAVDGKHVQIVPKNWIKGSDGCYLQEDRELLSSDLCLH